MEERAVIELIAVLIGGQFLFMLLVAAVITAFDFIANAFQPAFTQYEQVSGDRD